MQFIQPFGAESQHTPTRMAYFSVARGDERSKGENPVDKDEVLNWLERKGTRRNVEGMARYGIQSKNQVFDDEALRQGFFTTR
jgi:hypothetical protein